MAQPPETFVPSPKRLAQPLFLIVLFLAWVGVVAFALLREPARAGAWAGYAIAAGVPVAMLVLSVFYLASLMARTTVDGNGVRIESPLGRRSARWADVVGYNIAETANGGVTLYLRDGRRLSVPYVAYEGDGLQRRMETEMGRLPASDVEGREFRMAGRWGVSLGLLGLLAFLGVACLSMPPQARAGILPPLGMLTVLTVPFALYVLTDRVVLQNGTLTSASLFGTRRIALAEVRRAEVRIVSTKGGPREMLVLEGPTKFRLSAGREGYAMLRDAVVAALPPSVRPSK